MNNTDTIFSSKKVKMAGDYLTFYSFGKQFRVGGSKLIASASTALDNLKLIPKLTPDEIRAKSLRRAKRTVLDLIHANVNRSTQNTDKFLTLTQADFEKDITESNKHLHRFYMRLNRYLSPSITQLDKGEAEQSDNLKYLAVPEFQKNGTVHYHIALFGMPYVPQAKIAKLWGRGYVWVNKIKSGTDVGAYITKYMVKDISDPRLQGQKCYMTSKGLEKPISVTIEEMVNWAYNYVKGLATCLYVSEELPVPFLKSVVIEKFSLWRYPKEVRYLKRQLALGSLI